MSMFYNALRSTSVCENVKVVRPARQTREGILQAGAVHQRNGQEWSPQL